MLNNKRLNYLNNIKDNTQINNNNTNINNNQNINDQNKINETLNLTFNIEDENILKIEDNNETMLNSEILEENNNLKKDISQLKHKIYSYKKEIKSLKDLFNFNNIDNLKSNNLKLLDKVKSLKNENKNYKLKLKKFTFAYKYLESELNSLKNINKLFKGNIQKDDNFIAANSIVNSLTAELFQKNKFIEELLLEINNYKNESFSNLTVLK